MISALNKEAHDVNPLILTGPFAGIIILRHAESTDEESPLVPRLITRMLID